ncbi:MAG: alpha/beta hydrolase [Pirellulaceae bacterium]
MSNHPKFALSIQAAATVIGYVFAVSGVIAQEGKFNAPNTMSEEARRAVVQFSGDRGTLPEPDDIEGWQKAQQATETSSEEGNQAVVAHYRPRITPRTLGGVPVLDIQPDGWRESNKVLVYTHGGAYTLYSAESTLTSSVPVAHDTGLRVISIDYTLAPHARWNEITDQVISVMQALVDEGHRLEDIAIYGDSAGGGLAAGVVLKMRDQGIGMPAAVVLWSPWSDITDDGDTYVTLLDHDPVLVYHNSLDRCADAYANPEDQKHPYVSPVYGDYSQGFPPTLIQVGTKEIFLSNAVRHYQTLDNAGIEVKLDPYEGMWHVFQAFHWRLPESDLARKKMRTFLEQHMEQ